MSQNSVTPSNPRPSTPAESDVFEPDEQRKLDELRRFQVMTMPPDVRREWLLANPASVPADALKDTFPPRDPGSSDAGGSITGPGSTDTPGSTSWGPRRPPSGRSRARGVVILTAAAIAAAVSIGIALREPPAPAASAGVTSAPLVAPPAPTPRPRPVVTRPLPVEATAAPSVRIDLAPQRARSSARPAASPRLPPRRQRPVDIETPLISD